MRTVTALAFVALLTVACGDGGAPLEDANALQLPTVGLLGELPPAEGAVVVTLRADGSLSVQGEPCSWDALPGRLAALGLPPEPKKPKRRALRATMSAETVEEDLEETEDEPGEVHEQEIVAEEPVIRDEEIVDEAEGDVPVESGTLPAGTMLGKTLDMKGLVPGLRSSEPFSGGVNSTDLLLRVDRRVPWGLVLKLLNAAADPRLRMARTFYAVSGNDGAGEGALALFLPKDRGCGGVAIVGGDLADREIVSVTLRARSEAWAETGPGLADTLLTRLEKPDDLLVVTVRVPPEAPYGVAILAAYAALRAGAVNVVFYWSPLSRKPVVEILAAARDAGAFRLEVSGTARTLRPARAPELAVRHARYVGVTNDPQLDPEPVITDEELEEDER